MHSPGRALALLFAAMMLTAGSCSALDANKTLAQYAHRTWGQEEGLLQPTIFSIAQTRDGFVWLGTQDSLIRFDGVHFREYESAAAAGLERSLIRALLADPKGDLLVASVGSGVVKIRPDGRFERVTTKEGLPSNDAFCLASDRNGALWICTTRGLARLDAAGQIRVFTTADGLPSNQVRDSCEAQDGTRWVAGLDFGLSRRASGANPQTRFTSYPLPGLGRTVVTALVCGQDGNVWVGTADGVMLVESKDKPDAAAPSLARYVLTTRQGLPDNEVSSLREGPDGSLWIGTNDGISRYRNGEISVYRTRDGLSHSLVLSLYTDREGSLWAGTKDGLDQFTDAKVTPYTTNEGMSSNDAGPVIEDRAGNLWVGTLGRGLNIFDGHHFRSLNKRDGLIDDKILTLQVDTGGDLWAGTPHGLSRIRNGRVIASYTEKDGLSGPEVRALTLDSEGELWAGTSHGLDRLVGNRFVHVSALVKDGAVALSPGLSVRLFVSSDEAAFAYLKDNALQSYSLDTTHAVDCYYLEPNRREAWLGTLGSGLLRWKNGTVTHIRLKDGLFDNRIYSILRDDRGNFWMASSKGIFRVSEDDLQNFADGKTRYVTSIPFSTGQLRFECRAGVQPAACRTRDGRLWFATTNGVVVVDPNHLANNKIPPPVTITAIVVNGSRVGAREGIRLKASERNLEVRYAGLSFLSPEKVTFRYMLDGYDKGWTDAGSRREAFFTNLPPGDFRFRVMARNADGVWSEGDAALAFSVAPRIYQRRWFFPLLALLAAGAIALWYRMHIRRLKQRFDLVLAERSRIARELHDTLLQGLAGITMQLQAIWTKLPVSREKAFLGDVIQDAARCAAEARRSLWGLRTLEPGLIEFPRKLERLARQAVGESGVELVLKLAPVALEGRPEVEYQLLRIAQEAISNSLRHGQPRRLTVRLISDDDHLEMAVSDDGCGFEAGQSHFEHFGLVGMQERAREIGAEVTVESATGQGTEMRVILPFSAHSEPRPKAAQSLEQEVG